MTEFNEYFENEFFIIDSDNLDLVKPKFYGYSIQNNEIITENNYNPNLELDKWGTYLLIDLDNDSISISQDSNGNYGLYLYKTQDYFAISNSFLKLVEYLKESHELTFNRDYADAFLFAAQYSFSYDETLVNEIRILPKDYKIFIDKSLKRIDFEKMDYEFQSIDINSERAINILDDWFFKWVNILRSVKSKTNNITIDLTGGFDTRVVASLWLNANLDLDKVNIRSKKSENLEKLFVLSKREKAVFDDDYEIASEIADKFNFKLNDNIVSPDIIEFNDINTTIDLSFYTKLGFHKEMYFEFFKSKETQYTLTGDAGEYIRGYPNKVPKEYLDTIKRRCKRYYPPFIDASEHIFNNSLDNLLEKYDVDADSKEVMSLFYNDIMGRCHYGKSCVEGFLSNRIKLTPLLDCNLLKIKTNDENIIGDNLLIALIYLRYCPELLNFRFEGNRKIDDDILSYANEINNKFPLRNKDFDFVSGPELVKKENSDQLPHYDTNNEPREYLKNIFLSNTFEMEFKKYYSSKCYNEIVKTIDKNNFQHMSNIYSAIAIIKIINDLNYSNKDSNLENGWINAFINDMNNQEISSEVFSELLKFNTSRIDIRHLGGSKNSLQIIESSDKELYSKISRSLKTNKGQFIRLNSSLNNLDLKLKCIHDGKLNIKLRAPFYVDSNNNQFPVYVDYTSFSVDGEEIIEDHMLLSYYDYFEFKKDVVDSQIISIHVEWMPFSKSSSFNSEISELKKENKKLKKKYNKIVNSKSWKLTNPIRKLKKFIKSVIK